MNTQQFNHFWIEKITHTNVLKLSKQINFKCFWLNTLSFGIEKVELIFG